MWLWSVKDSTEKSALPVGQEPDLIRNCCGSEENQGMALGFDSCNWPIFVNFINGWPYQAQFRSIMISEHVTLKRDFRIWIDGAITLDSHAAIPSLELIAKWTSKLQALILLKIADRHWNYHGRILVHFLLSDTGISGSSHFYPCLNRNSIPATLFDVSHGLVSASKFVSVER
jgi:hypothetical protein